MKGKWSCLQLQARAIALSSLMSSDCRHSLCTSLPSQGLAAHLAVLTAKGAGELLAVKIWFIFIFCLPMDRVFPAVSGPWGCFLHGDNAQHCGEERGRRNGCGQREFLNHIAAGSCSHPAQDWAMVAAACG